MEASRDLITTGELNSPKGGIMGNKSLCMSVSLHMYVCP